MNRESNLLKNSTIKIYISALRRSLCGRGRKICIPALVKYFKFHESQKMAMFVGENMLTQCLFASRLVRASLVGALDEKNFPRRFVEALVEVMTLSAILGRREVLGGSMR